MSECTPTDADIREWFVLGDPDISAEFDRWLAAHDRAVKAEALRKAAYESVGGFARDRLLTRADQIEGDTDA